MKVHEVLSARYLYHLSKSNTLHKLVPVIPHKVASRSNAFEESTTPRVSFAQSIKGCILGLQPSASEFENGQIHYYVYRPKPNQPVTWKSNKSIVKEKLVFDASVTGEWWCLDKVAVELIGEIVVYDVVTKTIEYAPIRVGDPKFLKPNGKLDTFLYKYEVL